MPVTLQTRRLILEGHREADLDALAAMWADPVVVRHISGKPSTRQESWFRLLRYRGLWPVLGYGYWAIREKQSGRFVGDIGFADFRRDTEPSLVGIPEAGWVLASWSHGQGLASEALGAALHWLDQGDVHRRVVCLIDSENQASVRVAEKNGFLPAGMVTAATMHTPLFARDRCLLSAVPAPAVPLGRSFGPAPQRSG